MMQFWPPGGRSSSAASGALKFITNVTKLYFLVANWSIRSKGTLSHPLCVIGEVARKTQEAKMSEVMMRSRTNSGPFESVSWT